MLKRLLAVFGVGTALAGAALAQEGWARYRVTVRDSVDAERLANSNLQLFSDQIQLGETDVIVNPRQLPELWLLGLPSVFISNLPRADSWAGQVGAAADEWKTQFLRYDAIIAQYETWRSQNSTFISRQQIGTTYGGRAMWAYQINNLRVRAVNTKPPKSVMIYGAIHAREWLSPNVVMYLVDQFIQRVKSKQIGAPKDYALYVVPVVNPDGYEYTWTTDRYWRKNRRNNGGGSYGVDLNRNFSKGWGLNGGSSGNSSSDTYRGPSAFSEPEAAACRDYALTLPGMSGFIDYHTYGQYVLWPWGYTTQLPPTNTQLSQIGLAVRDAIRSVYNKTYTAGPTGSTLYIASGTTTDWIYDAFGYPPSYAIELRDEGNYGFEAPPSEILPTGAENWAGFKKFLDLVVP